MLVSSHVLSEVEQTVDDVVIIAKGRLVHASSLAELAALLRARCGGPLAGTRSYWGAPGARAGLGSLEAREPRGHSRRRTGRPGREPRGGRRRGIRRGGRGPRTQPPGGGAGADVSFALTETGAQS